MTSLESYLRGPYKEDGAFLDRLVNIIEEVIPLFYKQKRDLRLRADSASPLVPSWPYAISVGGERRSKPMEGTVSRSTHCMILFALDAFSPRGKDKYSILLGKNFRPYKLSSSNVNKDELRKVTIAAKKALVTIVKDSDQPIVHSGTYGQNDPFTLMWLTEIAFRCRADESEVNCDDLDVCKKKICEAVNEVLKRKEVLDRSGMEGTFRELPSSFLKLRRAQLATAVKRLAEGAKLQSSAKKWLEAKASWREFEDTIHRQLSYSSMGDPKFDPAELAFAFEGALLLHRFWISRSTIDQVFEALKLSKEFQPFWRPISPFLANDRGQVLFLVSVEVANSILRSCEILDQDEAVPIHFAHFEPHLRTYARWLLGEVERIPEPPAKGRNQRAKSRNLVGWRTEYADKPDTIHPEHGDKRGTIYLWHTSHVLVFLAHYVSLLKRKIGADGVEAAGLHVRLPSKIKQHNDYWDDEPLSSLANTDEKHYAVLTKIESQYIKPRENPEEDHSAPTSMLLYGPPGTGKTTLAEQMAVRLNRPLIVVTVSDFLAAGAAEIENRAKGVFEVLRSQEDVVVLFDEIDQFLLDRNSQFYQEQSDVFKFMTPGMLTKLQDLRDAEGSIFIIATNYYERIDSAIKRRGRIDEHLLLSIPDQGQRLKLLGRFVLSFFKEKFKDPHTKQEYKNRARRKGQRDFFDAISKGKLRMPAFEAALKDKNVLAETVLLGWGDLKNLVELKTTVEPGVEIKSLAASLAKAAEQVDSAVSLSAYQNRFEGKGPFPFEEFFLVLYLVAESGRELSTSDMQAIRHVLKKIPDFQGYNFDILRKEGYVKEKAICDKVQEHVTGMLAEPKSEPPVKRAGAETARKSLSR
ncbi:MAG: ATP-binding protein [Pyrinomonadaceae bacterium]